MSQTEITEFRTGLEIRDESESDERPQWEPKRETESTDGGASVDCEQCGATVTKQFARVFGDNDDRLINGCPSCSSFRELTGRED